MTTPTEVMRAALWEDCTEILHDKADKPCTRCDSIVHAILTALAAAGLKVVGRELTDRLPGFPPF